MDIRNYFSPQGGLKKAAKVTEQPSKNKCKKPAAALVLSSDEDIIPNTPDEKKVKPSSKSHKKRKVVELDSESDECSRKNKHETPKKAKTVKKTHNTTRKLVTLSSSESEVETGKKNQIKNKCNTSKKPSEDLKPISILEAFGNEPVMQTKIDKQKASSNDIEILSDDDFDKTLELVDEEELIKNAISSPAPVITTSTKKNSPKKRKHSESEIDIALQGQEKHEKRQYSSMLYQKYLNRSGPAHHGSKEIPKGKSDCLKNLCFVITGVLDSLDRNEVDELIQNHGGRTVCSVSKKVSYVIKGEEAGPSKLAKAESYKIPIIEEDDLLKMIMRKPDQIDKKGDVKETEIKNKRDSSPKNQEKPVLKKQKKSPEKTLTNVKPLVEKQKAKLIIDLETHKAKLLSIKEEKKASPEVNIKHENNLTNDTPKEVSRKIPVVQENESSNSNSSKNTPVSNLAWVDKYKPNDFNKIIGQQGDNGCVKKLYNWLKSWYKNQNGQTKLLRPSPWAKNDTGAFFKAVLLSGPPGIGKTTAATLVSQHLGLDIVEFNASDTRNKKLLHDDVRQILNTTSILGYFKDAGVTSKQHVLIMDEVDGMSGNEDRGGMQELISLIKNTNVPIICICNDRNHQKVRSLANYCFDLRFNKPRMEQIRGYLMTICYQENIDAKPNVLAEIINGTCLDIRQSIHNLYMWSIKDKNLSMEDAKKGSAVTQRGAMMTQWDVVKKTFTVEDQEAEIADRTKLFFNDYSIGPLFIYENYLHVQPEGCRGNDLNKLLKAANACDSLSLGDIMESSIRSVNNWSLLETQAIFSSVLPGYYMRGHFNKQINFPSWLGKNSKRNKFARLHVELRSHMSTCISGGRQSLHMDYAKFIRDGIVKPMLKNGSDGLDESMNFMQSYNLVRDDLDSLCEITQWFGQNPFNAVSSKVKSAFTRAYNKKCRVPYVTSGSGSFKKKAAVSDTNELQIDDGEEDANEDIEDETVENDAMIIAKKGNKTTKAATSKTASKDKKAKDSGQAKAKKKPSRK